MSGAGERATARSGGGAMLLGGLLFSDYFLGSGIEDMPEWRDLAAADVEAFRAGLTPIMARMAAMGRANESVTESGAVEPVLRLLGWSRFLTQQTLSPVGRTDIPDYLLFADDGRADAADARMHEHARYRDGAAFLEAKAWSTPLDRAAAGGGPSTQMLRYLSLADVQSNGRIRFAVLTDGRFWRLYDQKARSRSEQFLEVDLGATILPDLTADDEERTRALKTFMLFFRRAAFVADDAGATIHVRALGESRLYEERVTRALADVVFGRVFRDLADALRRHDARADAGPAYLAELREATLIYLYRLLFTLFAEDRRLLPTWKRDDGLNALRDQIGLAADDRLVFSARRASLDGALRALWTQIDEGDPSIGLPAYNGGLFRDTRAILTRSLIPDAEFAPILDALSRTSLALARKRINYRDLSVQHLGSIYERLLEYELVLETPPSPPRDGEGDRPPLPAGGGGGSEPVLNSPAAVRAANPLHHAAHGPPPRPGEEMLVQRPNPFARKTSGSYYTPEELVLLVIRRTLTPLIDERRAAFAALPANASAPDLAKADPASRLLDLTVLDPAMGSGHFLVSLVDWLADRVLEAVAEAEAARPGYASPLIARLGAIAEHIRAQGQANGWSLPAGGLEPRALVRRVILKRVIHGVDKNPMAVELAKLSLWLHTFTVGAPLSFLDHHLRAGDSLFGEWVRDAQDFIAARRGMMAGALVQGAKRSAQLMLSIEGATDADINEVHASADTFAGVEEATAPLNAMLSLVHAWRWLGSKDRDDVAAFNAILDGSEGDTQAIATGDAEPRTPRARTLATRLRDIAARERFLHWQVAFPNRWDDWSRKVPEGGFDAVIGNPPWDRMKLQEVEWFAARVPAIARAQKASDRKAGVARLKRDGDPLHADYEAASWRAESGARVARAAYPLLGKGDANLYSLFVERAAHLLKPDGVVGLLTPSGIAGDLGAAAFFRSVSTSGRLGALLDFENRARGPRDLFFPEVDSRFKFCALVFGGRERRFDEARVGFFLPGTADATIAARGFALGPDDFARVNPNTGTAPVFRTRRDADLTLAVYARVPALVDRRDTPPVQSWPVRYMRMFDMTNDSALFRTRAELEAAGCYPVAGNRWRGRVDDELVDHVPLYAGRMFWQFDHRAANVTVGEDNLHNPYNSDRTGLVEKNDPAFAT